MSEGTDHQDSESAFDKDGDVYKAHGSCCSSSWCMQHDCFFVVLYCNFTSLAFLGLLGFLRRQLKVKFIATLLSAAKADAMI